MKKNLKLSEKQWFKLDNAALIFPGQNTEQWSNLSEQSHQKGVAANFSLVY